MNPSERSVILNSKRPRRDRHSWIMAVCTALALVGTNGGQAAEASAAANPTRATETATFSGGCFWSMNAIFERLKGVDHVTAGFSGGSVPNPSYERVSTGTTGHAETVQITFDPTVISYRDLLGVFFAFHDPTTPNQQGADVGEQYRSAIFWHSPAQEAAAKGMIAELGASHTFGRPIVTQVLPYQAFYPAGEHHQAYYDKNMSLPYCQIVIAPKVKKLHKLYGNRLNRAM